MQGPRDPAACHVGTQLHPLSLGLSVSWPRMWLHPPASWHQLQDMPDHAASHTRKKPISRPTVEEKPGPAACRLRTVLVPPGASTSFRVPQGPAASYLETAAWGSLHTRQGLSISQTIGLVSSAYLTTMLNQLRRVWGPTQRGLFWTVQLQGLEGRALLEYTSRHRRRGWQWRSDGRGVKTHLCQGVDQTGRKSIMKHWP